MISQHKAGARIHRRSDPTVLESFGSISRIRSSAQQPCLSPAAARKIKRSADALQRSDPNSADVRGRVLQHGKHPEGDAGHPRRAAMLHPGHPDQPRVR
ncbi:hypothetical protein G9C98_006449 [Cotesia typhae]|uniref:Uncharacterized protein n=1 Tax=Cotesia typhae TaxID=2053667 RepID=A0A8J5RER8_9HYME|nr:hypothetical protein G9C98_006449 [Cotesia typhae]